MMYRFYKNIDGFKEHVGHRLEITGTVVEVHEEALELKATDGVLAEIQVPIVVQASTATSGGAVGTSGNPARTAVATSGSASVSETDDL